MQEYESSVRALLRIADGRSLDQAIATKDSPLSRQISYGVLRNFYYLSACLEQLLSKPLADKHQDIELLIMAGMYSIDHLNRPPHASVNFAVEAAKGLKKPWAKKLVNGVLRNYQRQKDSLTAAIERDEEAQTNHPQWLIDLIKSAYPQLASQVFSANQSEPPMTLRVNLAQQSRDDYLDLLQQKDMPATPGKLCATAIYLHKPVAVERLPGFADGAVSVQDEASQLITALLNVEGGMRVLDGCAAPGGKTCSLLEQNSALDLCAVESDEKRSQLIHQNLTRLKLKANVVAEKLQDHQPNQPYDRVLLDVPCSATGIIRRHPDIKLLRLPSDIDKLHDTQQELLAAAWRLLKEEGELVYSTCSILPSENQDIIARFQQQNSDVQVLPIDLDMLDQPCIHTPQGVQLLPNDNGTDGFFFSRLKKVST